MKVLISKKWPQIHQLKTKGGEVKYEKCEIGEIIEDYYTSQT